MRICNIMLGKGLGGIEQAFLDYGEGLLRAGHFVGMVTHPQAAVNATVDTMDVSHVPLPNRGQWDPFAPQKLAHIVRALRADIVITHGNRALLFAHKAVAGEVPIVAVAHNYNFQHLHSADMVFSLTRHMAEAIQRETGIPPERIITMPNMIRMEGGGFVRRTWGTSPVIGAMGRFVPKKGFDVFLHALALLKERGYAFRAQIAGKGEEERALKRLAHHLKLNDVVEFSGWVEDKQAFLDSIDVFCLPSHHEPFGIVLLEAMAGKLPIVTTDAEGPSEIIEQGVSGLVVPCGEAGAMAQALATLLEDESYARTLAGNAWRMVKANYEMGHISARITEALEVIRQNYRPAVMPASGVAVLDS